MRTVVAPGLALALASFLAWIPSGAAVLPASGSYVLYQTEPSAVGDFDGDGRPDLIGSSTYSVAVLFGEGDGSFTPTHNLFGSVPHDEPIALADLDGDGAVEVISAVTWRGSVSVTRDIDRTSVEGVEIPLDGADGDEAIVCGDFDGDGHPDAVTSDVCFLRGDGHGGLTATPCAYPLATGSYPTLLAADVDGDGRLDLVRLPRGSAQLSFFKGRGDGSFDSPVSIALPIVPDELRLADLNADGRSDLLARVSNASSFVVGLAAPGPSFAFSTISTQDRALGIAATDVDGDGVLDVVVADSYAVRTFPGLGDGTFAPATTAIVAHLGGPILVSDLDGDGDPDLVVHTRPYLYSLMNDRGAYRGLVAFEGAQIQDRLVVADFDGDGRSDIASLGGSGIGLSIGDGPFAFRPPTMSQGVYALQRPIVADVDEDGLPDMVLFGAIPGSYDQILLLRNRGDGTFAASVIDSLFSNNPFLVLGDFDGDGHVDLAWMERGAYVTAFVRRGRGDGTFEDAVSTSSDSHYNIVASTVADFNGDGKDDVAVSVDNGGTAPSVQVFFGDAGGALVAGPVTSLGSRGSYAPLAAGDVNEDGYPDLVTNTGSTLLGRGDGTFIVNYPTATPGYPLLLADVNGDAHLDLVTIWTGLEAHYPIVAVALGDGHGGFGPFSIEEILEDFGGISDIALGDFDSDGLPDLLVAMKPTLHVWLLPNGASPPNHAPLAVAGAEQTLECMSPAGTPATLDGSASSDPDGDPLTFVWSAPGAMLDAPDAAVCDGRFPFGDTAVTLTVGDGRATATATTAVHVVDTTPPMGTITFPEPGACFGPAALPVVVADDFADACWSTLARSYAPGPGPAYDAHGDHAVTLAVTDGAGNVVTTSTDFTIDTKPPEVTILTSPGSSLALPTTAPFTLLFEDSDDDGASGGVVSERVLLNGCVAYDGATYGNGDGLLSDESIVLDGTALCRIAAACGFSSLRQPVLSVEAEDCGGNVGSDSRVIPGSLALYPGACGR